MNAWRSCEPRLPTPMKPTRTRSLGAAFFGAGCAPAAARPAPSARPAVASAELRTNPRLPLRSLMIPPIGPTRRARPRARRDCKRLLRPGLGWRAPRSPSCATVASAPLIRSLRVRPRRTSTNAAARWRPACGVTRAYPTAAVRGIGSRRRMLASKLPWPLYLISASPASVAHRSSCAEAARSRSHAAAAAPDRSGPPPPGSTACNPNPRSRNGRWRLRNSPDW